MKLKIILKNIWDNKRSRNICIFAFVLILFVLGCRIAIDKYFENQYAIMVQQNEEDIKYRKQLAERKDKYEKLCLDYNNSVAEYNESVKEFNDFIDKVKKYNIIRNDTPLPNINEIDADFKTFEKEGSDFDGLEDNIANINNNIKVIESKHDELILNLYNALVDEYNTVANEYTKLINKTSVEFIKSISNKAVIERKKNIDDIQGADENDIIKEADSIFERTREVSENFIIATQITVPDADWIIDRLKSVKSITGTEKVTSVNDPNKLLNKTGGYKDCIYFSLKNIEQESVTGNTIIEKGTDCGGAIEVYPNLDSALNRCDYLSQFDNTLLYSGSYVLVGTMLIRTSCILSAKEQVELTNDIIMAFTEIKEQ